MSSRTSTMVEPIRYKPGEAIRWLELGANEFRKNAKRQGENIISRTGDRNFGTDVREAAGALLDFGRGALAELFHRQAQASEYLLFPDRFEVVNSRGVTSVLFANVTGIKQKGDKVTVVMKSGSVTIKPHAYVVSGKVRVPVGWSRNGLEVPFETLIDELSARSSAEVEYV